MKDFVYILGTGSRWRNNEIRYSLRSVARFFPDAKVFIIGEIPDWIANVTYIPHPDKHQNKQANAREKYLVAAKDNRISEDFILMNDDFFFLQESDFKNYTLGTLEDMIKRHPTKGGYYYQATVDTKNLLEKAGIKNPQSFEVHAPMVLNRHKLREVIEAIGDKKPYSFRSCYGNINRLKGTKVTDFKANDLGEFAWQIGQQRPLLSISDNLVIHKEFRDWIRHRFKNPSKYETDRGDGTDLLPGSPMSSLRFYAKETFTYHSKRYSIGEIIDDEDMDDIRYNKKMAHVWEHK